VRQLPLLGLTGGPAAAVLSLAGAPVLDVWTPRAEVLIFAPAKFPE